MKSVLKSKKGISPILATLLLIVIAVSAVIVTYAWVMTFTGANTGLPILGLENTRFYTDTDDYIEITIRNSGDSDAQVKTVYIGLTDTNLVPQTVASADPTSQIVAPGETLTLTMEYEWDDGTTYYFNIATEEGINLPFSQEA